MILVITALDCCVYCDSDNFNRNCEHDRTRTSFAKRPTPHTTTTPYSIMVVLRRKNANLSSKNFASHVSTVVYIEKLILYARNE